MTTLILLTAEQAGQVRGPSAATPAAALEPIALTDGRSILGVEVLADPAHAAHHETLAGLPTAELAEIAGLLPAEEEP